MRPEDLAARLGTDFTGSSARSIAAAIASLINRGELEPEAKLPTVRGLASDLNLSASTVADAWRTLTRHGLITTDRRRGTRVRSSRSGAASRYWQVPVAPGTIALDLSTGTPDTALLPPLGPILERLYVDHAISSYLDPPVLPALADELRRRWPSEPEAITVVDGAQDALDRCVRQFVGFGDTVLVEEPTFPPLLDLLDLAGAEIITASVDSEGLVPGSVLAGMGRNPIAVFLQPQAQNPTGASLSPARAAELATVFGQHPDLLIVEDDHSGQVSGGRACRSGDGSPTRC